MKTTRRHRGIYADDVVARFLSNIDVVEPTGCWIWKLAQSGPAADKGMGYGLFTAVGWKREQAHRASYRMFVDDIPEGLHVDHLCNVRMCVNPLHLEVVTQAENNRRGAERRSSCRRGHAYTPENTRYSRAGYRECRTCLRDKEARRDRRRVAA